ncbi:transposable element P transposase [Trichonephila clavipes]|nr:transposable element P transposase [Trichonephila clavipes]
MASCEMNFDIFRNKSRCSLGMSIGSVYRRESYRLGLQVPSSHAVYSFYSLAAILIAPLEPVRSSTISCLILELFSLKIKFQVLSVNSLIAIDKGHHLLDPYQQPITLSPDNQTCEFLSHKILSWLDSWNGKNCTTGTLTNETHLAFIHTTYALLEMSKYCINELKFQYFLPGKTQTDALESRFGKYRTLSGSQYLISIRQLYEVEAKQRMQNFLPLTLVSNTYDQLNLKDIHLEDLCNENPLESSVLHNLNITLSEKYFCDDQPYLPVLTYLAGVCDRAALKKLKCDFCSKSLVLNKSFELNSNYDLIRNLDRGSLLCPSPDVTAVLYNYKVVQKLLSNDYENMFLKQNNQRQIASEISISLINSNEFMHVLCMVPIKFYNIFNSHLQQCITAFGRKSAKDLKNEK